MKPAITRLEAQASTTLLTLLDDMFASCDDLFFDLASRAQSNLEQNLYFESMREVRIRTEEGRADFEKGLHESFAKLGQPDGEQKKLNDIPVEDLALVDEDQAELDVAVKSMTTRARAASKNPLYEFHARIESLVPSTLLKEEENPLDAGALIKLFVTTSHNVHIEIKPKIILLKQFERFVVNRLPEIYVSANTLLEELGVKFIDQKRQKVSRGTAAKSSHSNFAETAEQSLLNDDSEQHYMYSSPALADLSSLLERLRDSAQLNQGLQLGRTPLLAASSGTPLSSADLLKILQSSTNNQTTEKNNFDLRDYMRQLLSREQADDKKLGIAKIDEDIINLVAMFFDFVLDDHNIPDNVKALIGRLQMPILKVALKDKSFFTNTEHPCRHFINELSRISIGLGQNDANAHELLERMEQWVHNIQNESENIEIAFGNAAAELKTYSANLDKRAELVEKRTSEGAQGQARKQIAKMKAQKAIQDSMDGKVVAKSVADFIVNLWQQVLYRAQIKEGDESPAWLSHLQTMHDLIWCSQPHDDEKSRQRLDRIRENLITKLREGLKETTLNSTQINSLAEKIDQTIDAVSSAAQDLTQVSELQPFQAEKEVSLETLSEQKNWKEMSALERQQKQHQALTYEFIERADAVPVGSWLEFKVPSSGTIIRCKLAAKLEGSDTYVFVNRLGFKAIEKPRKEFAFDLQRKRARLLKSGPLFDRSLHKMVSALKSTK